MGPWHGELRGSGGWCSEPGLGFRAGPLYTHTLFDFSYFFLVFPAGAVAGSRSW